VVFVTTDVRGHGLVVSRVLRAGMFGSSSWGC